MTTQGTHLQDCAHGNMT